MPSEQQAGDRSDRLRCPTVLERIGEDPARWLDWDLMSHSDRREMVETLIKSIDSLERVRAWRAVERGLAADADDARVDIDKPRGRIMQWLDQREEWLKMQGERPDRLPAGPRRPCDCCSGQPDTTPADLRERDQQQAARLVAAHDSDGVDTTETSPSTTASSLGEWGSDGEAAD
jgi:hypothetical protein